jgi:hypothetical protein
MPNHYHLLVQTPDANLSRGMRHIDGVYTQRFNRFHGFDGPLFRGRYKSILVDADAYLLQLLRYIHRNPLEAPCKEYLDEFDWSSHKGYLSSSKQWDWLYRDFILSLLTPERTNRKRTYMKFIQTENSNEIIKVFEKKRLPAILGSENFLNTIKENYFPNKFHEAIPESCKLAPTIEKIKFTVCNFYDVEEDSLLKSRRGFFNEPRNMAIMIARLLRSDSLKSIGSEFRITKFSTVSSIIDRMRSFLASDNDIKKRADMLISLLTKSQT